MRPERRIERSSHIVGAKTIFPSGQHIFDFGIRERHRGVTAEQEAFLTSARFVQAVAPFVQSESFEEVAWKPRNGIGIESARYPQMFIKDRLKISSHDSFGNRFGVSLASTGQCSLKQEPV